MPHRDPNYFAAPIGSPQRPSNQIVWESSTAGTRNNQWPPDPGSDQLPHPAAARAMSNAEAAMVLKSRTPPQY
jgi:hypothetical protein